MMRSVQYLILGAGPSGATLATLLARAGKQVLVVDAHADAPAVIGESLLPFCSRVLDLLGVSMDGFLRKDGAVFTRHGATARFPFAESARPTYDHAYEVPRDDFDRRLRSKAWEAGAELLVAKAQRFEDGVLHTDQGPIRAELFIDAGGRRKFLATQMGTVQRHPVLRNVCLHQQFNQVKHPAPATPGDITICEFTGGWFWFIPFADGRTSVGLIMAPGHGLKGDKWAAALERCPDAALRLADAWPVDKRGGVSDFTAYTESLSGPGWALCGDAAMFLDPVFSAGVLFALESAATLAETLLADGDLQEWEAGLRRAAAPMEAAILAFYDGSFLEVATCPPEIQADRYRQGIISLLAGDLFAPGNALPHKVAYKFGTLQKMVRHAAAKAESTASAP